MSIVCGVHGGVEDMENLMNEGGFFDGTGGEGMESDTGCVKIRFC